MASPELANAFLLHLYEAVCDAAFGSELVEGLTRRFDLGMFFLHIDDPISQQVEDMVSTSRFDVGQLRRYNTDIQAIDPYLKLPTTKSGVVLADWQKLDQAAIENTPYQEWLDEKSVDLRWTAGAPTQMSDGKLAYLIAARSRRDGHYEREELAALQLVLAPIMRVVELNRRLGAGARGGLVSSLELTNPGEAIVVLGANGRLVANNAHADALFDDGSVIRLVGRFIHCLRAKDQTALLSAIAPAATALGDVAHPSIVVVHDAAGRLRFRVRVLLLPMELNGSIGAPHAAAALLIDDLERSLPTNLEILSDFGLTPAERELALGLMQGGSITEIALQRGKSRETLRAQLKSTMRKLQVSRQSQLVSYMLRLTQ